MKRMRCRVLTGPISSTRASNGTGYTLVELMITILVASVLAVIAVPGFQRIMASSRLTSTANELVGALHTARMDAIKHNGTTQFCSDDQHANGNGTLGTACHSGTGAVLTLVESGGVAVASTILAPVTIDDGEQQLQGHAAAIQFAPSGLGHAIGTTLPFTGLIADVENDAASPRSHRLVCMTVGSSIQVITTDGSEKCPG